MNNVWLYLGEQYWKDPDEFNPDRFINDQNEIVTPEAFIPFGYGNDSSYKICSND